MKQINDDSNLDDRLSDFTDSVLAGETERTESNADDNLRDLEETILRLKRAVPQAKLDDVKAKQWEARLANRLRKQPASLSFWQKWLGVNWKYGQFRPQGLVAVSVLVLAVVTVVIVLMSPVKGSSVVAAAFARTRAILTAAALLALTILIAVWFDRRK